MILMLDIVATRAPRHPVVGFHARAQSCPHTGQVLGNTSVRVSCRTPALLWSQAMCCDVGKRKSPPWPPRAWPGLSIGENMARLSVQRAACFRAPGLQPGFKYPSCEMRVTCCSLLPTPRAGQHQLNWLGPHHCPCALSSGLPSARVSEENDPCWSSRQEIHGF